MQTITIEVQNKEDAEVILLLAKRLHCKVLPIKETKKVPNSNEALKHLENIANLGTLKKKIPDPVKWQKSLREDVKLSGR